MSTFSKISNRGIHTVSQPFMSVGDKEESALLVADLNQVLKVSRLLEGPTNITQTSPELTSDETSFESSSTLDVARQDYRGNAVKYANTVELTKSPDQLALDSYSGIAAALAPGRTVLGRGLWIGQTADRGPVSSDA